MDECRKWTIAGNARTPETAKRNRGKQGKVPLVNRRLTEETESPERLEKAEYAEWCRWQVCPHATITTAITIEDSENVLFVSGCKKWECPVCGPKKRSKLIAKILAAKPQRFLTLTVQSPTAENGITWTPREAYDQTRRNVPELFRIMNRKRQKTEYCRVLEQTQKGYPHYHFLTRGPFWPIDEIREHWKRLTGSYIVDVRKPEEAERTTKYVAKYLTKANSIDFTERRYTTSRRFYRYCLACKTHGCKCNRGEPTGAWNRKDGREHWSTHIEKITTRAALIRSNTPGKYWVKERYAGSELPEELVFVPFHWLQNAGNERPPEMDERRK